MKYVKVTVAIIVAWALTAPAYVHAYPVPDVSGAKLILEESQLISGEPPEAAIVIKTYKRKDDRLFREYSVGGKVFRYDIDEDGAVPYEYRLLDDDGDGTFETREKLIGDMGAGGPGEKYFIDVGPEPGKEYKYRYEKEAGELSPREEALIIEGHSIYVPQWVLVEFQ